jgi:hypothetical protein
LKRKRKKKKKEKHFGGDKIRSAERSRGRNRQYLSNEQLNMAVNIFVIFNQSQTPRGKICARPQKMH